MSGGHPTATSMIRDAHKVFQGFKEILKEREAKGPLFLMGRSLGSASAIELAFHYQANVKGLIVESGFADALGLLSRFGVSIKGAREGVGSFNLEKIQTISIPTLIIHSQYDHIIPLEDGLQLHKTSGARDCAFSGTAPGNRGSPAANRAGQVLPIRALCDNMLSLGMP